MDTTKLEEALEDFRFQRNRIEGVIDQIEQIIAAARLSAPKPAFQTGADAATSAPPSYIDDAVTVLRQSGKPLHIRVMMERITDLRGQTLNRNSVEASIHRHITKAKVKRKLERFGRSVYGLPEWKEQPTLVQIA